MFKNSKLKEFGLVTILSFFLVFTVVPLGGGSPSTCQYPTLNVSSPYKYYNYSSMTQLFHELLLNNSDIMSLSSLGKTHEGRDIWMVKLSDNVDIDEDEPGVLLMGAHHGNEKPSFEVLIFFIQHMLENYGKYR